MQTYKCNRVQMVKAIEEILHLFDDLPPTCYRVYLSSQTHGIIVVRGTTSTNNLSISIQVRGEAFQSGAEWGVGNIDILLAALREVNDDDVIVWHGEGIKGSEVWVWTIAAYTRDIKENSDGSI